MSVNFFSKRTLYSPWFLAIVPLIISMFFISPLISEYSLTIENGPSFPVPYTFSDLNSDGISETVFTAKGVPYYNVVALTWNDLYIDQWNLSDSLSPSISRLFFGDYDSDKIQEVYVFTHKQDSLFLNVKELMDPTGLLLDRIFITRIGYKNGEVAAALYPIALFDQNDDGHSEFYFSVTSYFQLGPRKIYSYDIENRELNSSQFSGSIILDPEMTDADGDKRPEIYGFSSGSGNYPRTTPFSDSSAWFMVFDEELKFKFNPVEFPGFTSGVTAKPYSKGRFKGYVVLSNNTSIDTLKAKTGVWIFSGKGKVINYRPLREITGISNSSLIVIKDGSDDRIFVAGKKIYELNDSLEVIRIIDLPFTSNSIHHIVDIDGDNKDEIFIYSYESGKLLVYNSRFNKLLETDFNSYSLRWETCGHYSNEKKYSLFMKAGERNYFLNFKYNRYYLAGFLVYPGIYFSIVLFILLIRKITITQLEQREKLNQRLLTLQLQGIKSQLDPHFTFNSLNSIASLIYLEERHTAYDYLNKFTTLMRRMLNDADRIYRSIGEEIDFVTTYLDLEKMRFGDKLAYKIKLGKEVTGKETVPKLVLHTFAENAIKHGITPGEEGGMLQITVTRESDYLKIIIEDNGIGRERSAGKSLSTGKGLKLTGEFYDILNQLNRKPVTHSIIDLYDDSGSPAGTRVEVFVPLDLESDQ